jgi:flagellar M-ring protein FliF
MANPVPVPQLLTQLNTLTQLSLVRQLILMLLVAGAIALGTSVVLWSRGQNYTVLYSGLAPQDIAELSQALEAAQLRHRIEPGSGHLSVPEDSVHEVRLHLASLRLPRSSASGYDILSEKSSLGTSNFIEQARYNRALEQELAKTIKLLRGVRDVRVHVSVPKQSSFLRSSSKPGASVMLDLSGTATVSDTQIAGIAHLVASSVAGLDSADVSIVDQKGNLLSRPKGQDPLGGSTEQLKYTRNLEQEYTQRIIDILSPVVGPENIRAQVTADIDFTLVETTSENFDPARTVVRSEQTLEENRTNPAPAPGGTLQAAPPTNAEGNVVAATATGTSNNQSRMNATRNYEIDKSVSHVRRVPGDIRRLSVAVLVDLSPLTVDPETGITNTAEQNARLERMTQLVKDSIGYSAARGDSVNLIAERFSLPEEPPSQPIIQELWESPWVPSVLKQLGASIVILLLIFAVLKPALHSVMRPLQPQPALPEPGQAQPAPVAAASVPVSSDASSPIKQLPTRSAFDANLAQAQALVTNEPARAARMIKEWIASD